MADEQTQGMGEGCIPDEAKTSQFYRTDEELPQRFNNPEWFQGYGGQSQNPMFRTSANVIGSRKPTVHTMPTHFYGRSQKFSNHLGKCGNYRNHSLNTALDQSKV